MRTFLRIAALLLPAPERADISTSPAGTLK